METTPPIVGYVAGTNEPIYSLPSIPVGPGGPSTCANNACGCGQFAPPTLQELLDDVYDIAVDMDKVAVDLAAQLSTMDGLARVGVGEDALRLSVTRESLVRQLAVASQGIMTLKALIGTANQFLG